MNGTLIRDGLAVRPHGPFPKGFVYNGHRHWVDHYTYVHEGTVLLVKYKYKQHGEGVKQTTFTGPCRFLTAAGLFHEIEVISDTGLWDCEFVIPENDSPLINVFTLALED